jgi:starch synthase (maltosyl-transferring)
MDSMNIKEGRQRAVITAVKPEVEHGRFAIKRIIGDEIVVTADIFTDGHGDVAANLLYRKNGEKNWQSSPMQLMNNDRWIGQFSVLSLGVSVYTIHAWVDYFRTWQKNLEKKFIAGRDILIEIEIGLKWIHDSLQKQHDEELREWFETLQHAKSSNQAVTLAIDQKLYLIMRERYPNRLWVTELGRELPVTVDPPKALFSTWYEVFPRSTSLQSGKHGTFKDCENLIPDLAQMGFDVVYFPPIHPIGLSKRRGKNNSGEGQEADVGSPWAIGAKEGGHQSIHPQLGSMDDFVHLVETAKKYGIDIALDIAYQCSPDHPYLTSHPDWFRWLPDKTIQYAENPPKKYEDIVPFYFETDQWRELWEELRNILLYWIEKGVRIFRVDNPHTKPFPFWEWTITTIKQSYPDVIFLAEAFTRPKVMYWLAKIGFTQSYTYFTWRHTKKELTDYLTELTTTDIVEYFRPNLWTNTPDILTEELQRGGPYIFHIRLILAATLASNYGVYGPAFELMVHQAVTGTEEYMHSEKYEIHHWDRQSRESLKNFFTQINRIRKENIALQSTCHLKFYEIDNDQIIYYGKLHSDLKQSLLILVNLDPFHSQSGNFKIPLEELGMPLKHSYRVHELLFDRHYTWQGETQHVSLNPHHGPARIFKIQQPLRRESDFEYFM